jgi:hypothetical protein
MTYIVQIDDEIRDATPDEAAAIEATQVTAQELEARLAAQEAAKESARAKLAALGLTDDEVAALIP